MNEIIIGKKEIKDYLFILFKMPDEANEVVIKFMDCHDIKANSFIKGLYKFGWIASDPEQIETTSSVCIHNENNVCKKKESGYEGCSFNIRNVCQHYAQKTGNKILINQVTIQKHGALR